jgi:Na+:H+ antiporter, NhaC family
MQLEDSFIKLRTIEAVALTVLLLCGISFSIIKLQMIPHIPIIVSIMFLIVYGLVRRVPFKQIEKGMIEGGKSGFAAVMIFFFIGMLISSWIASGTIPTFIYLASGAISGQFYYAIVFIITAIIGMSIGSSLTTAATIGITFITMSTALDLSLPITAGAIISGAFFGDKMSPLSDTTNLASEVVKVDLFAHIKNMLWTTIPAFLLSLIFFAYLSPKDAKIDAAAIREIRTVLVDLNLVSPIAFVPFIILMVLALYKFSAIITLSSSIVASLLIAFFTNNQLDINGLLNTLYFGYVSTSGVNEVDALLTRGGIESMLFAVSLVILSLCMGGLLFTLGLIPAILKTVQRFFKTIPILISSAVGTAIGINFLIGEQYLSILLTGNVFQKMFEKAGVEAKHLSRVLEDAGTVINPLVPWGVCGIFLTNVLGVSTIEYLPFAFFCLFSPLITLFYGLTGYTITKGNR